jgi:ubiquinone/menaquinone biosynthesis C-methylase UbiE
MDSVLASRDYLRPDRYDRHSPGLAGDVAFYCALAEETGGRVLELGCGTGRISLAIARSGIPVIGLDNAPAMLAAARQKGDDCSNPRWVEADMRDFSLGQRFGLILIPYRGFQHLDSFADRESTLACIVRHLNLGGRLALDLTNPEILRPLAANSRVLVDTGRDRLRTIERDEMQRLLIESGFEIEGTFGDFSGSRFEASSPAMVWVARLLRPSAGDPFLKRKGKKK